MKRSFYMPYTSVHSIRYFLLSFGLIISVLIIPHYTSAQQTPSIQRRYLEDKFAPKECIYVLNGKVLGKGKDKIQQIDVKSIRSVSLLVDSASVTNYGGNPQTDMIALYKTFQSVQERKDSNDAHREQWMRKAKEMKKDS